MRHLFESSLNNSRQVANKMGVMRLTTVFSRSTTLVMALCRQNQRMSLDKRMESRLAALMPRCFCVFSDLSVPISLSK